MTALKLFCFRLKVSINFHDCWKKKKKQRGQSKTLTLGTQILGFTNVKNISSYVIFQIYPKMDILTNFAYVSLHDLQCSKQKVNLLSLPEFVKQRDVHFTKWKMELWHG